MATAEAHPEAQDGRDGDQPGTGILGRLLQLGAVALVLALLGLLLWKVVTVEASDLQSRIRAGEKPAAPAFELPVIWDERETWPVEARNALADGKLSLRELRGHPVVINFWASWCKPCEDEAPILAASARAHAGRVVFLGIDIQDFTSDARKFLERYQANYVSVRDASNRSYSDYGLTGVPETFYIDARGRAVAHSLGGLSRDELERGVAAATGSG
jgi:cytochrome c biogenesis protein CcmG/thiol:disulfide interchange protein DsbE